MRATEVRFQGSLVTLRDEGSEGRGIKFTQNLHNKSPRCALGARFMRYLPNAFVCVRKLTYNFFSTLTLLRARGRSVCVRVRGQMSIRQTQLGV